MKRRLSALTGLLLAASVGTAALAQSTAPAPAQGQPANQAARLEPGANSFTEDQARSRIEEAGFQNVTNLRKDENGIWRGQAMRGGRQVRVGLDYRGNVATE